jgi:uncharacterized protein
MTDRSSNTVLWGSIALALAFVVGSVFLAGGIRNIRGGSDTISVTGSAKRAIRSDFVVWRGSLTSQRTGMQEAFKDVKHYGVRLQSYLRDHRVPDSLVTFSSIENEPVPEYLSSGQPSGRILAYRLTQRFEVRSAHVDEISDLSNQATDLINEGIPLQSFPLEFLYTKLSDLRIEMLAEATRDARARAEVIARNAGNQIGAVRSARMGVFQITARNSTQVSDYGIYDTSSLDKDITAVVTLSFSLK